MVMGQLTKNFNISEFKCKDGTEVPAELRNNVIELAVNLQVLRDELGKPISITSGYRSQQHNWKIGGAKGSYHLKAMAADIKVKGMKPKEVSEVIEQLISEGRMKEGGIGIYRSWVHYDIRGFKARW